MWLAFFFFFQAEDGIRDYKVTGVQTCALPICQPALVSEFPTMAARLARRDEVDAAVARWVAALDVTEALARLDAAEVPCSRVASVRDIFDDAQVHARGNILELASPLGGLLQMVGVVPRLSAPPGEVRHPGPLEVGADNEEI